MRSTSLFLVVVFMFCSVSYAGLQTDISYTVENVSGNQWIYHYIVSNVGLTEGIEEFTIWFEHGQYASIAKSSDAGLDPDWDQITWQPNDALQNNGGFDGLALGVPIAMGENVSGFAVTFTWSGAGDPGSQFYEIVNPDNTSQVLDSGFTVLVPEPSTLILLISSSVCIALKKRRTQ